jgi:hypothetical protein
MKEIGVLLVEPFAVGQDGLGSHGLSKEKLPLGQPDGVAGRRKGLIEES